MHYSNDRKLSREDRRYLKNQLLKYEQNTPMTEEERQELHAWVDSGYSVYENPYGAQMGGVGGPLPFLDAYRGEKEIADEMRALEARGDRRGVLKYLAGLHHYQSFEDYLVDEVLRYQDEMKVHEQILKEHGLWEEACERVRKEYDENCHTDPAAMTAEEMEEFIADYKEKHLS